MIQIYVQSCRLYLTHSWQYGMKYNNCCTFCFISWYRNCTKRYTTQYLVQNDDCMFVSFF